MLTAAIICRDNPQPQEAPPATISTEFESSIKQSISVRNLEDRKEKVLTAHHPGQEIFV